MRREIRDHPILLVLGPTAAGKTDLAVALALALPAGGECISADSMQVYRGLDIGTAKPAAAAREAVPHHLLDVVEPDDDGFSVDRWLAMAEAAIAEVRGRGRHPIVVGGTNLYVQTLLEGLFDGPGPDPGLRDALGRADLGELRARLERIDPEAAERIHRNDRRRTVRALEVFEATGRPISRLQTQWSAGDGRVRNDVRVIGLEYGREALNVRINARVRAMLAAGLLEEVRALRSSGRLGPRAAAALGYRQLLDHLEGRTTLDEAVEQIKIRTRRLAKQQRTWLRRFRRHPDSIWIRADELSPQEIADQALAFAARRLVRPPEAGDPMRLS